MSAILCKSKLKFEKVYCKTVLLKIERRRKIDCRTEQNSSRNDLQAEEQLPVE